MVDPFVITHLKQYDLQMVWAIAIVKDAAFQLTHTYNTHIGPFFLFINLFPFYSETNNNMVPSGIRSTVAEGRLLLVHNFTTKPPRLDT